MPSIGDVYSAGTKIGEQTSFKFNFTGFNRGDIVPRSTGRNSLEFTLNNAKGNCYTIFSRINRPKNLPNGESLAITLSFEMRFVPDKKGEVPQATMGLGLCDPRGWDKTMSAAALHPRFALRSVDKGKQELHDALRRGRLRYAAPLRGGESPGLRQA